MVNDGAKDVLDLHGRVAMVTGAGQGVGRRIALHFAEHNAGAVIVNDFFRERAEEGADAVRGVGVKAAAMACDVADFDLVHRWVLQLQESLGPIEILVNNAGNAGPAASITDTAPFWETSPEDWATWIRPNFTGVLNVTHAVVGGMVGRGYGRVVTVISDAGRVGEPNLIAYSGAKAGAAGFSRALAKAVGRHGVTVNCVALATMRTPATEHYLQDKAVVQKILRHYQIKRLGEPEDAANMVLFLASDAASWITGQTFPVNGGYSMSM